MYKKRLLALLTVAVMILAISLVTTVYAVESNSSQTEESASTLHGRIEGADIWDADALEEALENNLIPDAMLENWQNSANRLIAAETVVRLIEAVSRKSIDYIIIEYGYDMSDGFRDTTSKAATFLKAAGISTGVGNNIFGPHRTITRVEMMTMLGRVAENIFGIDFSNAPLGSELFSDVPSWPGTDRYIGWAVQIGIAQGMSTDLFDSYGVLENQHIGLLVYRSFEIMSNIKVTPPTPVQRISIDKSSYTSGEAVQVEVIGITREMADKKAAVSIHKDGAVYRNIDLSREVTWPAFHFSFTVPADNGDFELVMVLTDNRGAQTRLSSKFTVILTLSGPPVFNFIPNRYYEIGGTIDYLSQVSVVGGTDLNVSITYNASKVNTTSPGRYPVTYTATDKYNRNNRATITVYVVMTNESIEKVMSYADRVLSSIIKDNMSQREKAKAIYDWVLKNIAYVDTGDKVDPIHGANNAFTKGRGDCYTFYAVSEILLTRAGIRSLFIERVGGNTRHYWQFVTVGDGWYHFDTTPYRGGQDGFLFDEATAVSRTNSGVRSHNYNRDLYTGLDIR